MLASILACRSHIELDAEDSKSYVSYLVKLDKHSITIDDETYSSEHCATSFDDREKSLRVVVNIFDNNFMGRNHREELNLPEGVMGSVTLLNFSASVSKTKSLFYQVYLPSDVFNRIVKENFQKLPTELTMNVECEDGSYFNDEWVKDGNNRYSKPNITEFHHFIDLK